MKSVAIAHEQWQMSAIDIAAEYELSVRQIEEALAFYAAHRPEVELHIAYEERLTAGQDG